MIRIGDMEIGTYNGEAELRQPVTPGWLEWEGCHCGDAECSQDAHDKVIYLTLEDWEQLVALAKCGEADRPGPATANIGGAFGGAS